MTELFIYRDGDLTVVAPPGFPVLLERRHTLIAISGGQVAFAVDESDPDLRAVIHDLDAAMWWMPLVFGAPVAKSALTATQGSATTAIAHAFPEEEPHMLRASLLRLGLALWLRRWWPTRTEQIPKLSEWLLDAEAGDLAFDCEVALGDDDELARRLLEPQCGQITAMRDRHQSLVGGQPLLTHADTVLRNAAHTLLEIGDPSSTGYANLAEADARASREDDLVAQQVDDIDFELLTIPAEESVLRSSSWAAADRFGSESGADFSGFASVDPVAVPPRVVSAEDEGVRWQIFEFDRRRLFQVTVSAEEGAVGRRLPLGGLFARVDYGNGLVACVVLTASEGGYEGETDLDATTPITDVVVTVYSEAMGADGFAPRSEAERRTERAAIAAIVDTRVTEARRAVAQGTMPEEGWSRPFVAELRAAGLDLGGKP